MTDRFPNGWNDEWTNGWMNLWTNGWMNLWTNGWTNLWTNGWTNERLKLRTSEWMDVWMSKRELRNTYTLRNELMKEWIEGWVDEWMDEPELIDELIDGWMNEFMNVWIMMRKMLMKMASTFLPLLPVVPWSVRTDGWNEGWRWRKDGDKLEHRADLNSNVSVSFQTPNGADKLLLFWSGSPDRTWCVSSQPFSSLMPSLARWYSSVSQQEVSPPVSTVW